MQQKFDQSIVARITLLMTAAIALTVLIIFSTVVISEIADNDAKIVNFSGSLRKDSFRMTTAILKGERNNQFEQVFAQAGNFTKKLNDPLFLSIKSLTGDKNAEEQFSFIKNYWLDILQPMIFKLDTDPSSLNSVVSAIEAFVEDIDLLVSGYQHNAEQKFHILRLIGLFSFFITILVILVAVYYIQVHVKQPLAELTENAEKLSQGDLSVRIPIEKANEFGLLAHTLNHTARVIANMHNELEKRIHEKTLELEHSNDRLNLLFTIARDLNNSTILRPDFTFVITELSRVSGLENINLCLVTDNKASLYLKNATNNPQYLTCLQSDCNNCINAQKTWHSNPDLKIIRFELIKEDIKYGVLICALENNQNLKLWQHRLLASVTDQLATNMSLVEKSIQSNRLALLQERTIIARELHDSLAQSLSYLKFQVSILDKTLAQNRDAPLIDQTVDELKQGLGSAYTQLRHLLTTFRLQMTGTNFKAALEDAISTVNQNYSMQVELNYDLGSLQLTPSEQIHLLQISKEALQNAFQHSNGDIVKIDLAYCDDSIVCLSVHDNGIGIPDSPEKTDHFGLSIMNERSKSLDGTFNVRSDKNDGTVVEFSFSPQAARQNL